MNQRKILLLENEAIQAAEVRELLSQAGFQIAVCRFEADGLKRLVEWGPDLVLVSTAHPAGDFVGYCRRILALAPGVRIIVTSPLDRHRLFLEYPALQAIVDGVLLRPYNHEEVAAMLATVPVAPRAPDAARAADRDNAELRAEFQRRLDATFLEVEELKRYLRQVVEETRKKAAEEHAALRVEMERVLIEKERLEERLHALETAGSAAVTPPVASAGEASRSASLEAELSGLRAQMAEGEVALADATAKAAVLEETLAREQALSRERAAEAAAREEQLLERAATAGLCTEQLQLAHDELEERLGASEAARTSAAAECERLTGLLGGLELQVATLRGELAAAGATRQREVGELETRVHEATAAAREARLQLEAQQASARELEERLAAQAVPGAGPGPAQAELRRIQELLEEVISRARTEAVDCARRDAELETRLQAALDERRQLQERFERVSVEAAERERRSSALLQSAIERGAPPVERANLPAVVPLDSGRGTLRWRPVLAGLAVAALVALLAVFWLRRAGPPAVRERQAAAPRQHGGAAPGAAATPREVWERWTRSDSSGGVLVQATLRSEQELRAEVEAGRAPGATDEEVRAEFARRLSAFRFDTTCYVTVYLKNLSPGYPSYLDDLPGRFRLRDGSGREVPAFLPPGHELDRRIFSFGAGPEKDLIYEASVSLGFERAGLSPSADYLQLVVSEVGASSRRVLTWELE